MTFLDTPMSGGTGGATNGTLTFMIGGSAQDFEDAKKVLSGMGANFFHCGGPGTGGIAKLCNNLMLGINMLSCAEGSAIGEKLGVDAKVLQQICSVSTSRSFVMDTYNPVPGNVPTSPASKGYEGGFGVSLIRKDMALAIDEVKGKGCESEMTEKAFEYFDQLEKMGFGNKDYSFVY